MNYREALEVLDLNINYTKKEVKKAYYKKCLQYHPDKNKSNPASLEMFQKIQNAYEFLQKNDTYSQDNYIHDNSYFSLLQKFISSIYKNNTYELDEVLLTRLLSDIIMNTQTFSKKVFESMSENTLIIIFDILTKYKHILYIPDIYLQQIQEILNKKTDTIEIIEPTLDDLLYDNVYLYDKRKSNMYSSPAESFDLSANNPTMSEIKNENIQHNYLYIPLWHTELYFDKFIFKIIPKIPEYMYIDDENNLHVSLNIQKNTIFERKIIQISLTSDKSININVDELYIRSYQKKVIPNSGLLKINTENIFDNSERSDIIIHIHIV
jgi:hypothetical protein